MDEDVSLSQQYGQLNWKRRACTLPFRETTYNQNKSSFPVKWTCEIPVSQITAKTQYVSGLKNKFNFAGSAQFCRAFRERAWPDWCELTGVKQDLSQSTCEFLGLLSAKLQMSSLGRLLRGKVMHKRGQNLRTTSHLLWKATNEKNLR